MNGRCGGWEAAMHGRDPRQATFLEGTIPLQQGILYGPVYSRRFGNSLGINLLPDEIKVCTLDCLYCQYSWTGMHTRDPGHFRSFLPGREKVREALENKLRHLAETGDPPQTITFSGNGEPTLHPEFGGIVQDLLTLRKRWAPQAKTAVLSNSTTVDSREMREMLLRLDEPVMKLDAGGEKTFRTLNRPSVGTNWNEILSGLRELGGRATIQGLFVTGTVDNGRDEEVALWAEEVGRIGPRLVQIYTLDRGPAERGLRPVEKKRLDEIARYLATVAGIEAEVFAN
jgi:wyosine [tRNA(Phe)-imidazoG37] synthetase (radical SAM superfamily)